MAGVSKVQQTTRIPEPTSVSDTPSIVGFLNRLVQTLRNNFNILENRISDINRAEYNYVTVSGTSYDVKKFDFVILCDTSSGNVTINLPPAANFIRQIVYVKKITNDANSITFNGFGTEEVEKAATYVVTGTGYSSRTLMSDGTRWWVI